MFRYRCPHCSQLLQSVEMRAGKLTVCSRCSQPLTIPADKTQWLNERGEPLMASPTVLIPGAPPEVVAGTPSADPETDVLGAIFVGAKSAREMPGPKELEREFLTPPPVGPKSRPAAEVAAEPLKTEPPVETASPVRRSDPTPLPRQSPVLTPPPGDVTPPLPTRASVTEPHEDDARRRRMVVSRPAPPRQENLPVPVRPAPATPAPTPKPAAPDSHAEPLRLRSQMDIAAELTAVLTTKMKPPPEPPRDIKPSTAVWLVATGLGLALLALALVIRGSFLPWLVLVGAGQVLAGYFWIVYLAARRDWRRGLLAAVPLVTPWFLGQKKYAKYRPARFVFTGALLLVAAGLSGFAVPVTRGWGLGGASTPGAGPVDDLAGQPKYVRLQAYKKDARLPALLELLEELSKTDQLLSDDARYRAELANELKQLCRHEDSGVRVRALEAYARWGGDDARLLCLRFLESAIQDEREAALRLLPRWKDAEVARAIAGHIGRAGGNETALAIKGVQEIGGTLAEDALIARLEADDQGTRLQIIKLLTWPGIGGPAARAKLRQLAENPPPTSRAFDDKTTREEAAKAAASLAAQLHKK